MGGWQLNPEQRTAADFPGVPAARWGIVSASAGARFGATASLVGNLRIDCPIAKNPIATA